MHVHVCPPLKLYNKFCGFYMAAVLGIFCGRDLSIHMRHENYPNKSKLVLFILLKALQVCTEKTTAGGGVSSDKYSTRQS